jgi:hypothetical protein
VPETPLLRQWVVPAYGPGRPLCRAVGLIWGDQVRLCTAAVVLLGPAWFGAIRRPRCRVAMSLLLPPDKPSYVARQALRPTCCVRAARPRPALAALPMQRETRRSSSPNLWGPRRKLQPSKAGQPGPASACFVGQLGSYPTRCISSSLEGIRRTGCVPCSVHHCSRGAKA